MAAQVAGTVLAFAVLAFFPPARGRMLLVPLGAASLADTVNAAIAGDARLVAAGPLPNSIVVDGIRDSLAAPMRRAGILVVAAPPAGCGLPG